MYRLLDNQTGINLAIVPSESLAKQLLSTFPNERVDGDPETVRYVFEEVTSVSQVASILHQIAKYITTNYLDEKQ